MKKFSFFSVLFVALFMCLSFDSSAQYVTNEKAVGLIEQEISNQKSTNAAQASTLKASRAGVVKNLIISVGSQMLEPIKAGGSVGTVLSTTIGRFNAANNPERNAIVAEV